METVVLLFVILALFVLYRVGYSNGKREGFCDGYRTGIWNPYTYEGDSEAEIDGKTKLQFKIGCDIGSGHGFEDMKSGGYPYHRSVIHDQGDRYSNFVRGFVVGYWNGSWNGVHLSRYEAPNQGWYEILRNSPPRIK